MTDLSTPSTAAVALAGEQHAGVAPPLWLLAELTYRCPLHCVFCYNPVDYATSRRELDTDQWIAVLRDARALGAAQLGFSGGEPLLRDDLETLVAEARRLGFYTNLITSGVGLTDTRLDALKDAGLDHIQLSFQDSTQQLNDFLSSTRTFDLKRRVAGSIKAHGFPMVLNCVLHRYNLPHVDKIIEMALAMGAEYLELANTQYYGWAYANRAQLLPTREQLAKAEAVVERYRRSHADRCRIFFVVPDYFENRPKRCMNGWGAVFLGVAPDGTALPCHAARSLPGLTFPNVADTPLSQIWYESDAFNRFRGLDWMKEPCRSCEEKTRDLGGCRCQAYLLTGDAASADPVCDKSPAHGQVVRFVERASESAGSIGRAGGALNDAGGAGGAGNAGHACHVNHAGSPAEQPILFRNDANSRKLAAAGAAAAAAAAAAGAGEPRADNLRPKR